MITTDHPTILVVDDDPQFRTAVTDALEMADYAVIQANDGEQALNQLQTHDVALILADVAMPGLNGYQLLHRVRQREQWLAIPFIFLTGRSLDSDIHYGKELGVDDYLTKPLDPDALLATVRGKLRRAQQWQHAPPAIPHFPTPPSPSFGDRSALTATNIASGSTTGRFPSPPVNSKSSPASSKPKGMSLPPKPSFKSPMT